MATRARRQFPGIYTEIFAAKATIDVASLADGAGSTSTITVPGVSLTLGDHVISWGSTVSMAGMTVTPYVSAADTVSLRFQNESGGVVDLASAVFSVVVGRLDPAVVL